jgi:hypothetical protein
MLALALEMSSLIRLRRLRLDRTGLFLIGGGRIGLLAVAAGPLVIWLATFGFAASQGGLKDLIVGIVLAAFVGPVYAFARHRYGGADTR